VALVGAEPEQAQAVCDEARGDQVLVPANYNAPGQIVISGSSEACDRAETVASGMGLRVSRLTVAGAFHSPLMQSAADEMGGILAGYTFQSPNVPVWSNVTGQPHDGDGEQTKRRLVEQIVSPVLWTQTCQGLPTVDTLSFVELAPGTVLRGLMRRINRSIKVINHDQP